MAKTWAMRQSAAVYAHNWLAYLAEETIMMYIKNILETGDHLCAVHYVFEFTEAQFPALRHARFRKELVSACGEVLLDFGDALEPYYVYDYELSVQPLGNGRHHLDFWVALSSVKDLAEGDDA